MSEESRDKYVLVSNKYYGILLVPKDALLDVCELVEGKNCHVKVKENYEWHPMCGGLDTWMQSYAVTHGRGWSCGEFNDHIEIIGIYYMIED